MYLKNNNLFLYTGPNSLNYMNPGQTTSTFNNSQFNPMGNLMGTGLGGLGTTNLLGNPNLNVPNPYSQFLNQNSFPSLMNVMPSFSTLNPTTTANTNLNALLIEKINNKTNNSSSNTGGGP